MAVPGYAEALLGGLPGDVKRVLTEVFRYIVPNGRFGPVEHQTKSESFQAYYLNSTTPSDTSEFSVVHGLGRTPYSLVPVLSLESSAVHLVRLTVTRPADGQRIYLKTDAGSTNRAFSVLVE